LTDADAIIERTINIPTAGGNADSLLFHPSTGNRWPGVIHLVDAGGIRPAHTDMAKQLSAAGYAVLMPNVFYRTGKSPVFDFPMKMGEERTTLRFKELMAALTPAGMEKDGAAYVDFLAQQPYVTNGGIGVVGYCFTGAMAVRTAAMRPERIAAAASFHGARLLTDTPDSPHLLLPRIKASLYFGHAVDDKGMPKEVIEELGRALESWSGAYENETYAGAFHSWTASDSPVYNSIQADRAFIKLVEFFDRTLK
jgi:carboxymethylenebutenolidase